MEKMEAHRDGGHLHRAFSVIVFSPRGEILLQRRAATKYHSQSLWTNTCCSHPAPGETTLEAAHRRLREEMGFDVPLQEVFSFVYRAGLDTGLTEYEYDHVLVGEFPESRSATRKRWTTGGGFLPRYSRPIWRPFRRSIPRGSRSSLGGTSISYPADVFFQYFLRDLFLCRRLLGFRGMGFFVLKVGGGRGGVKRVRRRGSFPLLSADRWKASARVR